MILGRGWNNRRGWVARKFKTPINEFSHIFLFCFLLLGTCSWKRLNSWYIGHVEILQWRQFRIGREVMFGCPHWPSNVMKLNLYTADWTNALATAMSHFIRYEVPDCKGTKAKVTVLRNRPMLILQKYKMYFIWVTATRNLPSVTASKTDLSTLIQWLKYKNVVRWHYSGTLCVYVYNRVRFLAYFPYFEKIKARLLRHDAVCVSVLSPLSTFECLNQCLWNLVCVSWHLSRS
jgi:hypothetical protein